MDSITYESFHQFTDWALDYAKLERTKREAFAFRGQANSDWTLRTTLDRYKQQAGNPKRNFDQLLLEFRNALLELDTPPTILHELPESSGYPRFELYARHRGFPTPILDFTTSPFIAAYFAFRDYKKPPSGYVSVWALDKRQIADYIGVELYDERELHWGNSRATAQRALFVRVPGGQDLDSLTPSALFQLRLPYSARSAALSALDAMKINEMSLFRNADSAAITAVMRQQY